MIKSMTGFGRASSVVDGVGITVEIKSVNHRYFEPGIRVPRMYMQLEDNIRTYIQTRFSRGKIDITISIDRSAVKSDKTVFIDRPLFKNYLTELLSVADEFSLKNDISLSTVLRFPDVVTFEQTESDVSDIWESVLPVLTEAADILAAQREAEGKRLCEDIFVKCQKMKSLAAFLEENAEALTGVYCEKLRKRIEKLTGSINVDEQRLMTEVAIMADKISIDEETVRLGSHIISLEESLLSEKSIGKSTDNLIQELNREVNTISSKIGDLGITKTALELKAIIEQIREQVQNIE